MVTIRATNVAGFDDESWELTVEKIPILSLTPSFQTVNNGAGTTTFTVDNTGTGTMAWAASVISGESWLSITSAQVEQIAER